MVWEIGHIWCGKNGIYGVGNRAFYGVGKIGHFMQK